jgi:hypothetical protein
MRKVTPYCGWLWTDGHVIAGYSIGQNSEATGLFAWRKLNCGVTTVENLCEPCYDAPYFILHSTSIGEYLFGQLASP